MDAIANSLCGKFVTHNEKETDALGRRVGETLARQGTPHALILEGALGAGKTCFVRGLVRGVGSNESVSSPTFALVHEYGGGRIPVAHLDFYRLRSAQEVWSLGWEDLVAECIVVAEWGNLFPEIFPADSLHLIFREETDGSRLIVIGEIGSHMQDMQDAAARVS